MIYWLLALGNWDDNPYLVLDHDIMIHCRPTWFLKKNLKYLKRVDKIKCKFVNGIGNALASTFDNRALRIKDRWQKESCRSPVYNIHVASSWFYSSLLFLCKVHGFFFFPCSYRKKDLSSVACSHPGAFGGSWVTGLTRRWTS